MWPELCRRRLLTSPVTQTCPNPCSRDLRTCKVSSLTERIFRGATVGCAGNNSPKSHCDLTGLAISPTQPRFLEGFNSRILNEQRGSHSQGACPVLTPALRSRRFWREGH